MDARPPANAAPPETLEELRRELARLQERLAALEGTPSPAGPAVASAPADDELIAVISAALAAFLGVKPHIRQVTVVGGASWAQQGRVTIQASHALK